MNHFNASEKKAIGEKILKMYVKNNMTCARPRGFADASRQEFSFQQPTDCEQECGKNHECSNIHPQFLLRRQFCRHQLLYRVGYWHGVGFRDIRCVV